MRIGSGVQSVSELFGKRQNNSKTSVNGNEAFPQTSMKVYLKTDDMLFSGGNGTGLSFYIKYAEESTDDNPVVIAKGIDENGKEFEEKIRKDEFYEYANVHGNYYGTLREEVESRINSGQNVILEIDVQGGIIVKEKNSEAILVFFKAPNMEVLAKRLEDRKTDTKDVIELRLANAKKELEYEKEYDYTVVNDNLEKACQELINIINK